MAEFLAAVLARAAPQRAGARSARLIRGCPAIPAPARLPGQPRAGLTRVPACGEGARSCPAAGRAGSGGR